MKIQFLFFSFLMLLLFASCDQSSSSKDLTASLTTTKLPSLKGKKVLMTWGGWPGHKPKEFTDKVQLMLEAEGAEIIISDSLEIYADSSLMAGLDLVIQSVTMGEISKAAMNGLEKAVRNGLGFAGAHGGFCDAFRSTTKYQYMTGAQFVAHPGSIINYTINVKGDDPITAGIKDFETKAEQYYMHVDPNVTVLATTTFDGAHDAWIKGSVMPVIWKKYHEKGRIYCIALGHDPAEFDVPVVAKLLMNGLKWAADSRQGKVENLVSPVY